MADSAASSVAAPTLSRTGARNRRRRLLDRAIARAIALGGVAVIIAITLIFVYLLGVVLPLFEGASWRLQASYPAPGTGATLDLALEEQGEIGSRTTDAGQIVYFRADTGAELARFDLHPSGAPVSAFTWVDAARARAAVAFTDGSVRVVQQTYEVSYPDDVRHIEPGLEFPLGEEPLEIAPGALIRALAVRMDADAALVAALVDDRLLLRHYSLATSLLNESAEASLESEAEVALPLRARFLLLDPERRWLYLAAEDGELLAYDLRDPAEPRLNQRLRLIEPGTRLTRLEYLLGGISLLAGASDGSIAQWFPVRDAANAYALSRVRGFAGTGAPVAALAIEHRRKGFASADDRGAVALYNTTAEREVLKGSLLEGAWSALTFAPRGNYLLGEAADGRLHLVAVDNQHPEVSWSSLWERVWYESYPEPAHVWQSSSASNDFEPKFSLAPLAFGTFKGAFYAMLFAVPLAIMGAIYTANFMSARMRGLVKPVIEIMEALPTVILGFLAGLWLAPLVEENLAGMLSMILIIPPGFLLVAYGWQRLPAGLRERVPEGWEAALLVPVAVVLGVISVQASPALEQALFGGSMREWLTVSAGISFDQRNALVVGFAMGFAVIPTIFSIAEDAIFSVPKHLTQGSLALGATRWQTLVRVVLLTASPGIFSAVMIGLGRAVGETMIVLMATGNTPVMDFNIFEGMRTLAANIAVEMPESEVDSTHYRVLFLAALVLFAFTFFFNTLAELVRHRLRRKYSTL